MTDFDIRVEGKRKNKRMGRRIPGMGLLRAIGRTVRFFLMRPRLLVAMALLGVIVFVGTPHIGWDYRCNHPTRGGQPCVSVSYCAYYGFQGRRIDHPP